MELTLRLHGTKVEVLRERAEEKTPDIVRRLYRRHYSEQHLDHHQELLQASGTRYVSPIR